MLKREDNYSVVGHGGGAVINIAGSWCVTVWSKMGFDMPSNYKSLDDAAEPLRAHLTLLMQIENATTRLENWTEVSALEKVGPFHMREHLGFLFNHYLINIQRETPMLVSLSDNGLKLLHELQYKTKKDLH
jgi:hypothetical protein